MSNIALEELVRWAVPVLLTAVAGWWALTRKAVIAWRVRRRARREAQAAVPRRIADLADSLALINKQLYPNGGGSLMDAVTRIERGHGAAIEEIRTSVSGIEAIVRAQSDLAIDGSFECDPNGANTWVNMTYARMLGVGRMDLLGLAWRNYIHSEDRAAFLAANASALAEHRSFNGRCRLVRSDNDIITVDVAIIPYPDRPPAKRWFGKLRLVA